MILYSAQGYDLRHFKTPIEPSCRTYQDHLEISAALQRLYEIIGTDQVLWMAPEKEAYYQIGYSYLHELLVGLQDVVAVLSTFAWEHIIGHDTYIPRAIWRDLRERAGNLPGDHECNLRRLEDEFLASALPENPWDVLFVEPSNCSDYETLVKFPWQHSTFQHVWAIERPRPGKCTFVEI